MAHLVPGILRFDVLGCEELVLQLLHDLAVQVDQHGRGVLQSIERFLRHLLVDGLVDGDDGCMHCGHIMHHPGHSRVG